MVGVTTEEAGDCGGLWGGEQSTEVHDLTF